MPNAYRVGSRFERKVAEWFKKRAFEVIRAAGSHGKAELWALKKNPPNGIPIPLLIQCKVMGPQARLEQLSKEQRALRDSANSVKARAVWAWRKGHKIMLQALN